VIKNLLYRTLQNNLSVRKISFQHTQVLL